MNVDPSLDLSMSAEQNGNMDVASSVELMIAAVEQLAQEAAANRTVSCAGLEHQVEALCAAALSLSPEEARDGSDRLARLIESLDRLAQCLRRQAEDGRPPQDQPVARHEAIRAYRLRGPSNPIDP